MQSASEPKLLKSVNVMSAKSKPFVQTSGDIWLNGQFVEVEKTSIPILTHGLHYGSAVFEGERAYGGTIFKSAEHTRRLMNSCNLLGFDLPVNFETFEQAKRETLSRSGMQEAYVRAIVWKGSGGLGVGTGDNQVNAAIAMWQMDPYFKPTSGGLRLDISDWRRPPPDCAPVKAKAAGLYAICTMSKDKAAQRGFDDALMYDYEGRVAECTGAHIFFCRDGALFTPKADWMIDGITRASVLEIAAKRGISVTEKTIMPDEMSTYNECFIVGSAVEVVPVGEIKGQIFTPGKITQQIVGDYNKMKYGRPI